MSIDAKNGDWNIELFDRIEPLEAHWRTLEAKGCCTLFQSYDWLSVWYEVTSRHGVAEPVIVAATRNGADSPEVILPLCRVRRRGYSAITFADIFVSDFAGPVFMPDAFDQPGAMRSLWDAINKVLPKSDAIHLEKMTVFVSERRNPLMDLPGLVPCRQSLWGMPLADVPWDGLPPGVKRDFAKRARRREARLAKEHVRRFEWYEVPQKLPEIFETLISIRMKRFEAMDREELLKEPVWLEFYRTIVTRRHQGMKVVIVALMADDEIIAMNFAFARNGALHFVMHALNYEGWHQYAPGIQLLVDTIRSCRRHGISYFDLSIGDLSYKKDLGAVPRPIYESFVPRTIRGWVPYALWRARLGSSA